MSQRWSYCFIVLLFLLGGCDLLGEEPAYDAGEALPGTERFVDARSFYSPGDLGPAFSPDGRSVVFTEFDVARMETALYVLDVAQGSRRYLTDGRNADWSPDGAWIAYNCGVQVCKIRADGTDVQQLTTEGRNFFPDWSPDGQWIAYDNTNCGNQLEPPSEGDCGVLIMKTDGSGKRWLLRGRVPDWHPSGQFIAGWKQLPPNIDVVYVYDLMKGHEVSPILREAVYDLSEPRYSPDGNRIAYANQDGLWVANADGSRPRLIVPNRYPDEDYTGDERSPMQGVASPSWHPDGRHLLYEHLRITRYRMNDTGPHVEGYLTLRLVPVD